VRTDTIAAIATPLGEGGIGIVRISGPSALKITKKLFNPTKKTTYKSHVMNHGWIKNGSRYVDEVMVSYMKAPNSYTGEDIVEISCHGGVVLLKNVLDLVIKGGARLAEKGEFTKRAFLNGKMDLTRAEAVIDAIKAKTVPASHIAAAHLKGSLAGLIFDIRGQLVALLAEIEASIDFPDEIGEVPRNKLLKRVGKALKAANRLIRTADAGQIFREGVSLAIVGRPNVGKSSLMNALLRRDRVIVTDTPGTTRDTIEEMLDIDGMPARIIDTAGIRAPRHCAERHGINRAYEVIQGADVVLLVLDLSEQIKKEDRLLIEATKDNKRVIVYNKSDMPKKLLIQGLRFNAPCAMVSAKNWTGMGKLERTIRNTILGNKVVAVNADVMINSRQKQCLLRAKNSLEQCLGSIKEGREADIMAIDLKGAIKSLGEVTGETVSEEIIRTIFERFCVGK